MGAFNLGSSCLAIGGLLSHEISYLSRYATSFIPIFLAWLAIYLIMPRDWPTRIYDAGTVQPVLTSMATNLETLASDPLFTLTTGQRPIMHLWFLPALLIGLTTLLLILRVGLERWLIVVIPALYGLILSEELLEQQFVLFSFHLRTWVLATLFCAVGWSWSGRARPSIALALTLLITGPLLAFAERIITGGLLDHGPFGHCYVGSILTSVAVFLLALAWPTCGRSIGLSNLGKVTLGIYLVHMFVIDTSRLWLFGFAVCVYLASLLSTIALSRLPRGRFLVGKKSQATTVDLTEDTLGASHVTARSPHYLAMEKQIHLRNIATDDANMIRRRVRRDGARCLKMGTLHPI
jgi:fucose 4-O-acetylase-like acetyltransferase